MAWRILDRSDFGRSIINNYVGVNPSVSLGSCGSRSSVGCSNWEGNTVTIVGGGAGAAAVTLAHEIYHVNSRIPLDARNPNIKAEEEISAHEFAEPLYRSLRGADRRSARGAFAETYQAIHSDRNDALRQARCAYYRIDCQ